MKWIFDLLKGFWSLLTFKRQEELDDRREDRRDFALVTMRWQSLADRIEADRDKLQRELDQLRKDFFKVEERLDTCDRERLDQQALIESLTAELRQFKKKTEEQIANPPGQNPAQF